MAHKFVDASLGISISRVRRDRGNLMKTNQVSPSRSAEFILCVFIVPLIFFAAFWVPLRVFGLGTTADFIQFYAAGAVVAKGAAPHFYDLAPQSEILRQFTHPPFEAVLYAPFALFSYATAFRLWTLLSLSSLGLIFFYCGPMVSYLVYPNAF